MRCYGHLYTATIMAAWGCPWGSAKVLYLAHTINKETPGGFNPYYVYHNFICAEILNALVTFPSGPSCAAHEQKDKTPQQPGWFITNQTYWVCIVLVLNLVVHSLSFPERGTPQRSALFQVWCDSFGIWDIFRSQTINKPCPGIYVINCLRCNISNERATSNATENPTGPYSRAFRW